MRCSGKYIDKLIELTEVLKQHLTSESFDQLDLDFFNYDLKLNVNSEEGQLLVNGTLDTIYEEGLIEFARLVAFAEIDAVVKGQGYFTISGERDRYLVTLAGLYLTGNSKRHVIKECPLEIHTPLSFSDNFIVGDGYIKSYIGIPRTILNPKFSVPPNIWCKLANAEDVKARLVKQKEGLVGAGVNMDLSEYDKLRADLRTTEIHLNNAKEERAEWRGRKVLDYRDYLINITR